MKSLFLIVLAMALFFGDVWAVYGVGLEERQDSAEASGCLVCFPHELLGDSV